RPPRRTDQGVDTTWLRRHANRSSARQDTGRSPRRQYSLTVRFACYPPLNRCRQTKCKRQGAASRPGDASSMTTIFPCLAQAVRQRREVTSNAAVHHLVARAQDQPAQNIGVNVVGHFFGAGQALDFRLLRLGQRNGRGYVDDATEIARLSRNLGEEPLDGLTLARLVQ